MESKHIIIFIGMFIISMASTTAYCIGNNILACPSGTGQDNITLTDMNTGIETNLSTEQTATGIWYTNYNFTSTGTYCAYCHVSTAYSCFMIDTDCSESGVGYLHNIAIIFGVGVILFLIMYFALQLDEQHFILKLLLILSSISLSIIIPLSTFSTDAGRTFYRSYLYIFGAFWLYVIIYFVYYILKKMNLIVGGGDEQQ